MDESWIQYHTSEQTRPSAGWTEAREPDLKGPSSLKKARLQVLRRPTSAFEVGNREKSVQ